MNQELFLQLNKLVSENIPTQIIKRGNAFSLSTLSNINDIKTEYNKYSFTGLNIYQSQGNGTNLTLKGEAFFTLGKNEIEMDAEIQFQASLNKTDRLQILQYIYDLSENTIFIEID